MRLSWNALLLNFNRYVNIAIRISILALCLLEVHESVGIEMLQSLFKSICPVALQFHTFGRDP